MLPWTQPHDTSNDASDEMYEAIPSDDDDDEGPEGPSDRATSSQRNNQIPTRDDPISEGEGFQGEPSNSGEDPQSGPEGQQNQVVFNYKSLLFKLAAIYFPEKRFSS